MHFQILEVHFEKFLCEVDTKSKTTFSIVTVILLLKQEAIGSLHFV